MKATLAWLNDAISAKGITGGMNHYKVQGGEIRATDGRITAGHPWTFSKDEFLVPGVEFEKVLARMPETPKLEMASDLSLVIKSGRFKGTVQTLPLTHWDYPGIDEAAWKPLPKELPALLEALRPFVSNNAVQQWALCVALEHGWAYATNNVAIAGGPCKGLEKISALLPVWAVDFMLGRLKDLTHWTWTDSYVAFRWKNKAWMRSQLVVGVFPEKAAAMIRESVKEKPGQKITPEFRQTFERIAELAEDTVAVYADRVESRFGKAVVEDGLKCQVPESADHSLWGAAFLLPALQAATSWGPSAWPQPAPWKGPLLSGYVVGRRQ